MSAHAAIALAFFLLLTLEADTVSSQGTFLGQTTYPIGSEAGFDIELIVNGNGNWSYGLLTDFVPGTWGGSDGITMPTLPDGATFDSATLSLVDDQPSSSYQARFYNYGPGNGAGTLGGELTISHESAIISASLTDGCSSWIPSQAFLFQILTAPCHGVWLLDASGTMSAGANVTQYPTVPGTYNDSELALPPPIDYVLTVDYTPLVPVPEPSYMLAWLALVAGVVVRRKVCPM